MSAPVRDRLKALILDHFREGSSPATSWRLDPGAAADAILAEFPILLDEAER